MAPKATIEPCGTCKGTRWKTVKKSKSWSCRSCGSVRAAKTDTK